MTASKEVVARRAIIAATQARRPRSAQPAARRGEPPPRAAGLGLTATGLICILAVHIHSGAVNVRTAGIIVTALGLAWLWIAVPHMRALLRRQLGRAMSYLAWDPGASSAVRCSLAELLEPCSGATDDRAD